jgi:hypothetical protein
VLFAGRFAFELTGLQFMPDIMIEVWDATGNKRQQVEVPVDSEVNRVIAVLVDRMTLPRHSPDGQMMSYKFHHKASGRQLLDTQTLADAGVSNGDILRLQPEITAGSIAANLAECIDLGRAGSGRRYV